MTYDSQSLLVFEVLEEKENNYSDFNVLLSGHSHITDAMLHPETKLNSTTVAGWQIKNTAAATLDVPEAAGFSVEGGTVKPNTQTHESPVSPAVVYQFPVTFFSTLWFRIHMWKQAHFEIHQSDKHEEQEQIDSMFSRLSFEWLHVSKEK